MTYETRMDLCDPHPNFLKLKFARAVGILAPAHSAALLFQGHLR